MKYIWTIVFLLSALTIHAQSWDDVKASKIYLYGEGWGNTLSDADKQALADLISKISMNVSSVTNQTERETVKGDKLDSNSDFQSSIQTYSQATLTNTERIVLKNEPNAHVGRWIKRSEIQKIFESRKLKITDLVETAVKAEKALKIDNALRCYYWANLLLKSLQNPNEMTYEDEDGKQHVLAVWIPEQMNNIFENLKASYAKNDGSDVELRFTYKGMPVASVDYTYFDGRDWSSIYSAKDGVGILELPSNFSNKQYQLKYEFEYRGQAHIDKELESVMNTVKSIPLKNAYVNVKANKVVGTDVASSMQQERSVKLASILQKPIAGADDYYQVIQSVIDAIKSRKYDSVNDKFTADGLDIYNRLIKYGSARVIGTPTINIYQDGGYVVGRGLQMSFSFKNGVRKAFVEDIVFTFDENKKIDNISFGLGQQAESDILGKGVWAETARKAIMDFLENYKTAYALKRLDYIKTIFDDDAVIITAKVDKKSVMTKNREGVAKIENNKIIKYNRQTKDEYIRNLAMCFASNEFVNIRFANNDVIKLGKGGEMYAIQISQDYYSTNYGDKGYLFLIVDINNPKQPLIKVRTWQPEKDPNFGLYGPGDF